ncbi:hypothetical protein ARSEF4850_001441 [Beauveria asiatica]
MLGNKTTVAALRELAVPPSSTTQREIHFVAGSLRDKTDKALLIVETDCTLQNKIPAGRSPPCCHEVIRDCLPLAAQAASAEDAASWAISRLILSFASVVCIFINDIRGGLRSVAQHLASWLADGPPPASPVLPWLLLVNEQSDGKSEQQIVEELIKCLDETCRLGSSLLARFANVSVVALGARGTRHQPPNWQDFRAKLSTGVSGMQEHRKLAGSLFSVEPLCRMMECASSSISSMSAPLDLALATRVRRPVCQYLETDVMDFLDQVDSREMLEVFAIPVVASSIIFDHYMRNMHLFDKLYRANIDHVGKRLASTSDESKKPEFASGLDLTGLLIKNLERQFTQFRGQRRSALLYHADKLISFQKSWKRVRSSATCFSCLTKRPKHELPCKHWICADCYDHFSAQSGGSRYLPSCILCGEAIEGGLGIRNKPRTATLRLLCVDGGGANAGKPLASLKALEAKIGLGLYPVQHHFNIIYGTSSGLSLAAVDNKQQ